MATVAVLGCGPAGLLAAHGVAQHGHTVTIHALKVRSKIGGAQYIHQPIPGLIFFDHVPKGQALYKQAGTREGYASKVYGDPAAPVSWDRYPPGTYEVWSMQGVYDQLWSMYQAQIFAERLDFERMCQLQQEYDHVISSVPLPAICGDHNGEHGFDRQRVWIDYGPAGSPGPNVIIYDGTREVSWYRYSNLFGWHGWEYSFDPSEHRDMWKPHFEIQKVDKPLSTDCNCWTDTPGVTLVGRYGKWSKDVLAHHAYVEASNIGGWL